MSDISVKLVLGVFYGREREYKCTKLGGASLPRILTCVIPALGPGILSAPGSPMEAGPAPHMLPFDSPDLSRPLLPSERLLPPMDSRVLSNQGRHGNILRTFPGNTSGNIHSSGREAGRCSPSPGWGRTRNQVDTSLLVQRKSTVWGCRRDRLQRKTNQA